MKSNFGTLNLKDVVKGFLLAIITSVITAAYQLLQTGASLDWATFKPVLLVGLTAGIGYLVKNVLTNNNDQFLQTNDVKPEPPTGH